MMRNLPAHSRENAAKAFAKKLRELFDTLGNNDLQWHIQLDSPILSIYVLGPAIRNDKTITVECEADGGEHLRKFRLTVECIEAKQKEE